jgi:glycerol uptake facilitator-like aquaporin
MSQHFDDSLRLFYVFFLFLISTSRHNTTTTTTTPAATAAAAIAQKFHPKHEKRKQKTLTKRTNSH